MITRIGIQILGWLLLALLAIGESKAQQVNMYWQVGTGLTQWQPVSAANPLPVNATVNASVTGFPGTTQTTGTPISVTTGGVTGTLPSGAVVVASNVGATNAAYCKLGASATTSDQYIAPGSWFGFTVGSNTQLTCITSTSTTTVNMVGGAGLPTGAGGGGGGSGSNSSVASTGGAVPSTATYIGVNVGGNLTGFAPGTAGTASTQVLSIQGIASMTAVQVSAASGAIASGAIASGAVASGAFASGALASGSIAAGAQVDLLTMRGTKNAGTAAANSLLAGAVFNNTPLTLTDTQQASLQADANGYLKVNVAAGGASGGTSSNFGSAFPTPGTASGYSDGTNMQGARVFDADTGAGTQYVLGMSPRKAASGGSVELFTSSDPGLVTLTGTNNIATVTTVTTVSTLTGGGVASASADSGNPVKVGCKYNATPVTLTDGNRGDCQADVNGFLNVNVKAATGLAQGSTTSGQTGSLVMAAVTTAASSYTNAQTSPLSLTTAGGLRGDQASWAGTALGTPTNFGTTPGAVVAASANSSLFLGTVAASTGNGVVGTGVQRVAIASDNTAFSVNATLSAETTKVIGTVRNKDASGNDYLADPCQRAAKTYTPISITTATTTRIVAPTASNRTYICHIILTSAAADNIGIVEGTGGTCGTGTAGVIGGTTAANGPNFAANGGLAIGSGGFAVAATAGTNVDLCLITSASTPLAGHIAWVQAP